MRKRNKNSGLAAFGAKHSYTSHIFCSFEDFEKQLAVHNRKYDNFPIRPLDWKTPAFVVKDCLTVGKVF